MKTILIAFLSIAYFHGTILAQDTVNLTKTVTNNSTTIEFENQRKIETEKMVRFTSRLESNYPSVSKINYDTNSDKISILFNTTEINEDELKDILSHFNVFHFSILPN